MSVLLSEMICAIAFLDSFLNSSGQSVSYAFEDNYDFIVFDDPCEMREALRIINAQRNAARIVAGEDDDLKDYIIRVLSAMSNTPTNPQ